MLTTLFEKQDLSDKHLTSFLFTEHLIKQVSLIFLTGIKAGILKNI